jgi:hypothetical protein
MLSGACRGKMIIFTFKNGRKAPLFTCDSLCVRKKKQKRAKSTLSSINWSREVLTAQRFFPPDERRRSLAKTGSGQTFKRKQESK